MLIQKLIVPLIINRKVMREFFFLWLNSKEAHSRDSDATWTPLESSGVTRNCGYGILYFCAKGGIVKYGASLGIPPKAVKETF